MTSPTRSLPIGIFDSGVGGLTVLKAIRELLPGEDLLYLGDTARLPYGTKSPQSITRYARQATSRLSAEGIKLLVVACNTASAVALETLEQELDPLPVLGVVEPGATAAVAGHPGSRHLVLATEATVRLGAYRRAVLERDPAAEVRELACELLVALAEEGWTDGPEAPAIVRRYVRGLDGPAFEPDCVILGCTHFPIIREAIAAAFDRRVRIVDSASTTAAATRERLAATSLSNPRAGGGRLTLLATDGAGRFARVGGRFLGEELRPADIRVVDL